MLGRRSDFLIVVLLALAVRIMFLVNMDGYPRFELIKNRLDDQVVFHQWAASIVDGRTFDYGSTAHEFAYWARQRPGVYPQAPLYPWFVAVVYRVAGLSPLAVRVVQMVLGALGCGLLFLVAIRFLRPPVAFGCGFAAALYGPAVFYEGTFLRAGIMPSVVVISLLLLLKVEPEVRLVSAAAGLALAAGVLLRPTFLLPAAVALLWLGLRFARRGWWSTAVVAGALFAPLLLVAAVNTVRSGEPAFLSSNGPYIFFISNVHDSTGISAGQTESYWKAKASGPANEVDLTGAALADIRRHPGAFLRLQGRKLAALVGPAEIPNNLSLQMGRRTSPVLRAAIVSYPLLAPVALIGLLAAIAAAWRLFRAPQDGTDEQWALLLVVGFLGAVSVGVAAFLVFDRIRLTAFPMVLLLAGVGFQWAIESFMQGNRRRVAAAAVTALVVAVVMAGDPVPLRTTDYQMAAAACFSRAQELEEEMELEAARLRYVRSLVLNPEHEGALERILTLSPLEVRDTPSEVVFLCDKARQDFTDGATEAALAKLAKAADAAPDSPLPLHFRANILHGLGRTMEAAEAMEQALQRDPTSELYRTNLIALRQFGLAQE